MTEEKVVKDATEYTMSEGVPIFLKSTLKIWLFLWLDVGIVLIPTWMCRVTTKWQTTMDELVVVCLVATGITGTFQYRGYTICFDAPLMGRLWASGSLAICLFCLWKMSLNIFANFVYEQTNHHIVLQKPIIWSIAAILKLLDGTKTD